MFVSGRVNLLRHFAALMVCALQLVPVSKKLVLIYVVNDIIHKGYHCSLVKVVIFISLIIVPHRALERANDECNDPTLNAFLPYLVLIFRLAADSQTNDVREKIAQIPKIWFEKGIVSSELATLLNCVVVGV